MKNFWNFDIFYPKIFNFSSKISLKFSSFLEGWNIDQRLTRCWTFISRARQVFAHIWRKIIFAKNAKIRPNPKIGCLCLLGTYTWHARAGYQTVISYLQHISISYKTYYYNKSYKKSKIGHHFPIFYHFFTHFLPPGFWHFHRFLGKKIIIFFWPQYDPISLLNP